MTSGERKAVALTAHGLPDDEIADRPVISPATTKTYISQAMAEPRARARAETSRPPKPRGDSGRPS
ncbi:hypothetical protein [Streptomyces axinellae]|uniref:HTH luxR-type domain-containing protein n=1 Tax=Streptomyces axinellae TaxID=552788 RepID=A0ABP6D2I6_9ACTN